MKAVDGLCEAVKEEGILCGTALANVNLPATKQHLVGQDTWGAAAWIKASDRYMKHLDFWGVNLYTRRYFAPMGLFHRFHDVSNRPLVITESTASTRTASTPNWRVPTVTIRWVKRTRCRRPTGW